MIDRVKLSPDGLFVSKKGKSVDSSDIKDFVFHPDQNTMPVIASGDVYFTGNGSHYISIDNPNSIVPYVDMKSSDGHTAVYYKYCAILEWPFTTLRIVNRDDVARTVSYTVYL